MCVEGGGETDRQKDGDDDDGATLSHKHKNLSTSRPFDTSVSDDNHSKTQNSKIKYKSLWQNKIQIIIQTNTV